MNDMYKKICETVKFIKSKIEIEPKIGIILGSGLGPLVKEIENKIEIDYKDIPNFPLSTVEGHEGMLVFGTIANKPVMAMKGRFHYYEGYDPSEVTFAVRTMKLLGIKNLLVTNAAGGVNKSFKPGDLMIIKDHIGLFGPSPLRGKNIKEFGPRFNDMSEAYNKKLIELIKNVAKSENIELVEGVYAYTQGPMYETPAEIRVLSTLGADAVGMSTVPEVTVARHSGMKILGISCITNMAAGILDQPLKHEEVMQTAKEVEEKFLVLVKNTIKIWE